MIRFDHFIPTGDLPIYMQIIRHIKRGAAAGIVQDGDELPSRRMLSSLLGVNPNTVQKAYHLLEEEELMSSRAGSKSLMTLDAAKISRIRRDLIAADAGDFIRSMREIGLGKAETLTLLDRLWEE